MAVERKPARRIIFAKNLTLRWAAWALLTLLIAGCATACAALHDAGSLQIGKIALLAPFEGQYRALGYNALHTMRLAVSEAGLDNVQLLPVDDGGDYNTARARMQALNLDSTVVAILALGEAATHPAVQQANDKALILIGNWGQDRVGEDSLFATDAQRAAAGARDDLLIARRLMVVGTAAPEFFTSNGALAEAQFAARYRDSGQHAHEANWLASLTYDLTRLVLASIAEGKPVRDLTIDGIHGELRFDAGYWQGAPVYRYQLDAGGLKLLPG